MQLLYLCNRHIYSLQDTCICPRHQSSGWGVTIDMHHSIFSRCRIKHNHTITYSELLRYLCIIDSHMNKGRTQVIKGNREVRLRTICCVSNRCSQFNSYINHLLCKNKKTTSSKRASGHQFNLLSPHLRKIIIKFLFVFIHCFFGILCNLCNI